MFHRKMSSVSILNVIKEFNENTLVESILHSFFRHAPVNTQLHNVWVCLTYPQVENNVLH